ncbi:ribbon-helix-helix domain-containing protein [Methanosarcina sp. Mfa9]|uniref:ribbon-helix-helix domain-containing protein n=1 Tax=Methanosarcina sp. Mfa9 TaxID=3439063 RepID=UPI003F84A40C
MDIQYKKEKISATVSPYIKKQVDELVKNKEFSSVSDLVSTALTEFLVKYNQKTHPCNQKSVQEMKETPDTLPELIRIIMENEEGRKIVEDMFKKMKSGNSEKY